MGSGEGVDDINWIARVLIGMAPYLLALKASCGLPQTHDVIRFLTWINLQ